MTKAQRTSVARLLACIAYDGGKGSAAFHVATYERMRAAGYATPDPGRGWTVTDAGFDFLKNAVAAGLCPAKGAQP